VNSAPIRSRRSVRCFSGTALSLNQKDAAEAVGALLGGKSSARPPGTQVPEEKGAPPPTPLRSLPFSARNTDQEPFNMHKGSSSDWIDIGRVYALPAALLAGPVIGFAHRCVVSRKLEMRAKWKRKANCAEKIAKTQRYCLLH
jgi:hypothetical protein